MSKQQEQETVRCPVCHGEGEHICTRCHGWSVTEGGKKCPRCDERGMETCKKCSGTGWIRR